MDAWPISLQQKMDVSGFQKKYGSTRVSSTTSVGPAKVRSRYTDGIDVYETQTTLDFSDVATFETFYKTTIVNGTLPFTFTDPFTLTTQVFRFVPDSDPSIRPLGGRVFTLSMVWEKVP
jgi:hypothetical protein